MPKTELRLQSYGTSNRATWIKIFGTEKKSGVRVYCTRDRIWIGRGSQSPRIAGASPALRPVVASGEGGGGGRRREEEAVAGGDGARAADGGGERPGGGRRGARGGGDLRLGRRRRPRRWPAGEKTAAGRGTGRGGGSGRGGPARASRARGRRRTGDRAAPLGGRHVAADGEAGHVRRRRLCPTAAGGVF